jgi:hypothetical protein
MHLRVGDEIIVHTGYYCATETTTLVPGILFDNHDTYWFYGYQEAMHIAHHDQQRGDYLVRFPRNITIEPDMHKSRAFMDSLNARLGAKGRRQHVLYPIPDSFFVWNDSPTLRRPAAQHATLRDESEPTSTVSIHQHLLDQTPIVLAADAKPDTERATNPLHKGDGAIYVWAQSLDPNCARTQSILKGLRELEIAHHRYGHFSMETTIRMLEWAHGKTFPKEVLNNLRPCAACDEAKIKNRGFKKSRLVAPTEAGDATAVDTIVNLPRSLSGFRHVAHMHDLKSDYGAPFLMKTKVVFRVLLYWLKHVYNVTRRHPTYLFMDSGEFLTEEVVAYCESKGVEVSVPQPGVHGNTTIERRHRTFKEVMHSLMNHGGAGPLMWEFAATTAGWTLNLIIKVKKLRAAGRPGKGRARPLSPFEEFVNHGKPLDLRVLLQHLHHLFGYGIGYRDAKDVHTNNGRRIIYLGPCANQLNVTMYAHNGLDYETGKVHTFRVVKTYPIFPWRPTVRPPLSTTDASGAPLLSSPGGEAEHDEPMSESARGVIPERKRMLDGATNSGEKAVVQVGAAEPTPTAYDRTQHSYVPAQTGKRAKEEKFPPGTKVMTTAGPCTVRERYADGDYCVIYADTSSPEDAYTVKAHQIWLPHEYLDYVYDSAGTRQPRLAVEPVTRMPVMQLHEPARSVSPRRTG